MNIAITGGSGFVGKHLCNYLSSTNNIRQIKIWKADNSFKIKSINHISDYSNILDGIDVVIHCASIVHEPRNDSSNSWLKYKSINIDATTFLANEAEKNGVKRLIFISTVKVNGDITKANRPFHNDSEPNPGPKDFYALSKYVAEKELLKISNKSNLEIVIIRPPLIYGPGVKANFLNLLKIVKYGLPLPFSSNKSKRSFIFIGNLVDFIDKCTSYPEISGKTFLISDSESLGIKELITKISFLMKKKHIFFYFPSFLLIKIASLIGLNKQVERLTTSLEIDPYDSYSKLKWTPPFSIDNGLKKTIDWFISSK